MAYSVNCISSESENYHNTMATFLGFKMIFAKKMFHDLSLSVPSSNQSIITIKWLHIYYDSVINNWNNLYLVVTMPRYDTYYMDSRGKEYWCVSEGSECRTCNVKIIKDKVLSGLLSGAHWLENLNTKFKQGRKLDQSNVMLWWTGRSKAECCRLSHSAGARIHSVLGGNITGDYLVFPGVALVRTAPRFSWTTTSLPATDWTSTPRAAGTSSPRPSRTRLTSRRSVWGPRPARRPGYSSGQLGSSCRATTTGWWRGWRAGWTARSSVW